MLNKYGVNRYGDSRAWRGRNFFFLFLFQLSLSDLTAKREKRLDNPCYGRTKGQTGGKKGTYEDQCTLVQHSHESRHKSWATGSSVGSFARTVHSFACSALLASHACSAALIRSLARSIAHSRARGKVEESRSQNQDVLKYSAMFTGDKRLFQDTSRTRPDTRHKMHLVCVLFTFQNNTGHTDRPTDGRTYGRTQPLIAMRRRI